MAVVNLTEARIRDLPPGSGIWRDEQVKGLMVMLAASFAPDTRHKRFLKRVADELCAKAITDRDRHLAIEG